MIAAYTAARRPAAIADTISMIADWPPPSRDEAAAPAGILVNARTRRA